LVYIFSTLIEVFFQIYMLIRSSVSDPFLCEMRLHF
jgi:hypothetical protein